MRRTIPVGSTVRCERKAKTAGTWSRFVGRVGTVVSNNNGEVAVAFDTGLPYWFRPTELVVIKP